MSEEDHTAPLPGVGAHSGPGGCIVHMSSRRVPSSAAGRLCRAGARGQGVVLFELRCVVMRKKGGVLAVVHGEPCCVGRNSPQALALETLCNYRMRIIVCLTASPTCRTKLGVDALSCFCVRDSSGARGSTVMP